MWGERGGLQERGQCFLRFLGGGVVIDARGVERRVLSGWVRWARAQPERMILLFHSRRSLQSATAMWLDEQSRQQVHVVTSVPQMAQVSWSPPFNLIILSGTMACVLHPELEPLGSSLEPLVPHGDIRMLRSRPFGW